MNLIQLALAAEKLSQERPPVEVEAARCHHAKDKDSPCDLCVTACPTEAISLEGGVQVQADQCIRCGLCLHTCPAGVFDGHDGNHDLLHCVDQLVDRRVIEVACKHHPDPTKGARGVDAVIQTSGCLSALGESAYVSLLALGVEDVRVRLDACADCPLRIVQPTLEKTVNDANALVQGAGSITIAESGSRWWRGNRPVYSVKNPPLSRRGFFRMVTLQTEADVDELAPRHDPQVDGETSAPRERRRLIRALSKLDGIEPNAPVPSEDFTDLMATDACTACGMCARVCPTDALNLNTEGDQFELAFIAADCTNCGLCFAYCDPDALHRDGQPTFAEVISGEEKTLITGDLQYCQKCGAAYTGESEMKLCPLCAARRNNPFNPNLPPAVLKRLPPDVQERLRQHHRPSAED